MRAAYADEGPWALPVTERITADSLILPLFHDLSLAEQDMVVDVVDGCAYRDWAGYRGFLLVLRYRTRGVVK